MKEMNSFDDEEEYQHEIYEEAKRVGDAIRQNLEKAEAAHKLMELLEIPCKDISSISIIDLYDILMDDKKLKIIVSKLHNKVFW